MKYHIKTAGCQMNVADSRAVALALEGLGYQLAEDLNRADVVVLNTCVVRQSAEDKAINWIHALRPLKEKRPDLVIHVMGCLVGVRGDPSLRSRFPFVDVFSAPSDPAPLIDYLMETRAPSIGGNVGRGRTADLCAEMALPHSRIGRQVSAYVSVVYGCSHACTYCVIPYRRGVERSRSPQEIFAEVQALAGAGIREITLLGQIVDRYGLDLPQPSNLARLLRQIHEVDGIQRIRFLTSHPNWVTEELLNTIVELPKVCEHIEVPIQAGSDEILRRMKRGYRAEDYRRLIDAIRQRIPEVSIATDVIVGFPGETPKDFQQTHDLLAELKMDVAHLARFSPRPGTVAARRMADDVPAAEKEKRFRQLEALQAQIAAEINGRYLGRTVEILVEGKVRDRWRGRTRTNKLVFFEAVGDWLGIAVPVHIDWTGPWSMVGTMADRSAIHSLRRREIA